MRTLLILGLAFWQAAMTLTQAAESFAWPNPPESNLPPFHYLGVVLHPEQLKYRPHPDIIYPSVVRMEGRTPQPLGKYYLYYAPHDAPGGICVAFASRPEGPWTEYTNNPVIRRDWAPHYKVSHVSGPDAIWNEEEHRLLLYFHGENNVTRLATSSDGIHFSYEGAVLDTKDFEGLSEASYGRVFRHTLPGKDNRYIMLLMGNNKGTRRIYLAWSKDGRRWQTQNRALLDPPPGTDQVAGAVYLPWQGRHYIVSHAHDTNAAFNDGMDLYLCETDAAFAHTRHLGKFMDRTFVSATNGGVMSPSFLAEAGRLYLYFNIGPRLQNSIALAATDPEPDRAQTNRTTKSSPFAIEDEAEFFSLLDLDRPDLAQVRQAVVRRDWAGAKAAWARHLQERTQPEWVWSRRERPAMERLYAEKFGGLDRYTNAADRVLARDFNLLGVRKQLAHEVQWLHGPIEWTHVLSRFAYWQDLGLAYWATGRKQYAEDFVDLLEQWIAANPVPSVPGTGRGTNGSVWRTLEAGIRSDTWFEAMELFMDAPAFDAQAKYLMTRSLAEHARYLYDWSRVYRAGNWQVCEASGLAEIGMLLPEFKAAAAWRTRGFSYLVEHMQKDVEPDGAHYELTPGYHTWVMTQYLKVALLCRKNGYEVPGLMERHEKMFEFLMALRKPDGDSVPVGDVMGSSKAGLSDSLGLGSLLYHRADLRYLGSPECAESWVRLFGSKVCDDYARQPAQAPSFTSVLLPNAKYAVMRTGWEPDARFLFFDCAPWRGAHSHQDRLQVVVSAGRDLLVDPGVYSYDQPLCSQYFRRSEAHNVVVVDGQEQPNGDPELLAWQTGPRADFAAGAISPKTGDTGLRHQRSVLFIKPDYWVMTDTLVGSGKHEVARLFHFPLGAAAATTNGAVRTGFPKGMNLEVRPLDDGRIEMRPGWLPTGLAQAEAAPYAAVLNETTLPATFCTVLLPFSDSASLPRVERISPPGASPVQLRLTFPDGRQDEIVMAPRPQRLKLGRQEAVAWALAMRRGPGGEQVIRVTDAGTSTPGH